MRLLKRIAANVIMEKLLKEVEESKPIINEYVKYLNGYISDKINDRKFWKETDDGYELDQELIFQDAADDIFHYEKLKELEKAIYNIDNNISKNMLSKFMDDIELGRYDIKLFLQEEGEYIWKKEHKYVPMKVDNVEEIYNIEC